MTSIAIGIAGLVACVLSLRFVAYRWMEKERRYRLVQKERQEKYMKAVIAVPPYQHELGFVAGEIVHIGKLAHER